MSQAYGQNPARKRAQLLREAQVAGNRKQQNRDNVEGQVAGNRKQQNRNNIAVQVAPAKIEEKPTKQIPIDNVKFCVSFFYIQRSPLLHVSTSIWVLHTPNAGQNMLFQVFA